jgi:Ribbon-helix-helix domain
MKSPVIKRSVIIGGHRTSISLEDEFWSGLKEIAQAQSATVAQTVGSPGCTIPMVRFFSACDCRYSFSGRRQRLQSEKFTRGSRSGFCSAMADASMQPPTT